MRTTSRWAALSFAVTLSASLASDADAQDAALPVAPPPSAPAPPPSVPPPSAPTNDLPPASSSVDPEPAAEPTPKPPPLQPLSLPPPAPSMPIVDASTAALSTPGAVARPDQTYDAQLYGGIVVAGVGAALFVVAGMAVSRIDQIQDDPGFVAYRAGFLPNVDVCDRASAGEAVDGAAPAERVADLCDEASRWEIANYVAMPGGVAMLGMGLYLILTSETAQVRSPVSFAPHVGPTQAGLTVSGRF